MGKKITKRKTSLGLNSLLLLSYFSVSITATCLEKYVLFFSLCHLPNKYSQETAFIKAIDDLAFPDPYAA